MYEDERETGTDSRWWVEYGYDRDPDAYDPELDDVGFCQALYYIFIVFPFGIFVMLPVLLVLIVWEFVSLRIKWKLGILPDPRVKR